MWGFASLLKSHMKKKSIHEISIYAKFSCKSAPKPVEHIVTSRLERVNASRVLLYSITGAVFNAFKQRILSPGNLSYVSKEQ